MAHFPLGKQQVSRPACRWVRRAYRFMNAIAKETRSEAMAEWAARIYRKSETVKAEADPRRDQVLEDR
jgi:hypothetical protein